MGNTDTFDLAGQQEAAERAAKEKARLQALEVSDLKWLMQDKRGRRVAYSILERAGVFRSSFDPNALRMAFNEGNRNEGLALLHRLMTHCPELYAQMLKEHSENHE